MRLPDDRRPLLLGIGCALSTLALGACASGAADPIALTAAPATGPQADYPIVIGAPYTVAGTSYTPEDVLNYDQVGYLAVDAGGGSAISGAHHTLPLPSYVEVTSLETGRTILVRLERRGPMDGNQLVALSPGALTQLEARAGTPVRVRRVNPAEDQRALLRTGQPAPPRIDTPMALVDVLKRRLPAAGAAALNTAPRLATAAQAPRPTPVAPSVAQPAAAAREPRPVQPTQAGTRAAAPALPPLPNSGGVAAAPSTTRFEQAFTPPAAAPARQERQVTSGFIVQAGAFSTADRAGRVANALDAKVSRAGSLYRVRTGPFATRREAEASLAKVRAAGYRDARIQTSG